MSRIHQLLSGAGPVDAVTSQALEYRRLFERWGMAGEVHAAAIEPRLNAGVLPLKRLEPAPDDLLLIHYSAYAPRLEPLLELPQRKLLVYHNVTPARYLWSHHPHVATLCQLGRDHLPRYARAVDVACAVSGYNARELREAGAAEVRVVPILFEPPEISARSVIRADAGPSVLGVGRLVPHKRQDLVVRAFALWQREHAADASLALVGEPLSVAYRDRLDDLARRAGGMRVQLTGPVSDEELGRRYAGASVFLTLSEHEGFCVPLLEAFAAGVPVVARPVGGMPEVGGDAVLWAQDDDVAVVAELLELAVRDEDLRGELIRRGRARLEEFAYERTAEKLRAAVDAALSRPALRT
ncbi:MAG: glycosyltransferase [Thermoleophilaceae bacterium]